MLAWLKYYIKSAYSIIKINSKKINGEILYQVIQN